MGHLTGTFAPDLTLHNDEGTTSVAELMHTVRPVLARPPRAQTSARPPEAGSIASTSTRQYGARIPWVQTFGRTRSCRARRRTHRRATALASKIMLLGVLR